MSDLYCQRCDEPYDVCHVGGGDMDAETEDWDGDRKPSQRFISGEGCPACDWGKKAPKEKSLKAMAMGAMAELLGDDIDGMAAMMDDAEFAGMFNEEDDDEEYDEEYQKLSEKLKDKDDHSDDDFFNGIDEDDDYPGSSDDKW